MQNETNWKPRFYLMGTFFGALIGLATTIMWARSVEEEGGTLKLTTKDAVQVALTVIGAMRGVSSLGSRVG